MSSLESEQALGEYVGLLRRQWPLLLIGLVVGGVLGWGALAAERPTYESTTSVLVQPTGDDINVANGRTASTINLDTEAQIVTSSVVAKRSVELLQSPISPRELVKQVIVGVPPNTSVLNITFAGSTPSEAQEGAVAFARAYLDNRKAVAEQRTKTRADGLKDTITSLNAQLRKVNADLTAGAPGARTADLTTQRDLLVQQIRSKTAELGPLLNNDVQPGAVITEAQRPTVPTGVSPVLVMVSALFVGLLLGVAGAVLRARSDHRIRARRDLERLGLDMLVSRFALPAPDGVLRLRHPHDEPLRQCRNALLARLDGHRGSFLVTSASSGRSGTTVAASLAVTLARSGVRTALVCCNTETDIVEDAFGVRDGVTLTDVLRSRARPDQALHPVSGTPNLSVVPSGRDGSLFSELLQETSIRPILSEFENLAEVVVLDVAPTAANADAQTVVTATQGLLLVATAGVTTSDEVVEAIGQMTNVNAVLLGSVLVDPIRERKHSARSRHGRGRKSASPPPAQDAPTQRIRTREGGGPRLELRRELDEDGFDGERVDAPARR